MSLRQVLAPLAICASLISPIFAQNAANTTTNPSKDTITVIGLGDIMPGTNYPFEKYLPPNKGKDLFGPKATEFTKNADLTFGNFEGTILNDGGTPKRCKDMSKCYAFRSPEYLAKLIPEQGIDVVSLANNHAGDMGNAGRKNTIRVLEELGIYHAGQNLSPITSFEKDGVKYGLIAVSPNTGTVQINGYKRVKKYIRELKDKVDILIVSFHGGAEGTKHQHVTRKTEKFYGENRGNVWEFAHMVIDEGADIVFGHGPHVTRAMEVYKNKFIIYSLGNYATYGRFSLTGPKGVAPAIKLWVNKSGDFIKGQVLSTYQTKTKGPRVDPKNRAMDYLKKLTAKDFPEVKFEYGPDNTFKLAK